MFMNIEQWKCLTELDIANKNVLCVQDHMNSPIPIVYSPNSFIIGDMKLLKCQVELNSAKRNVLLATKPHCPETYYFFLFFFVD